MSTITFWRVVALSGSIDHLQTTSASQKMGPETDRLVLLTAFEILKSSDAAQRHNYNGAQSRTAWHMLVRGSEQLPGKLALATPTRASSSMFLRDEQNRQMQWK